jgi:acetyl esterase/lipase
MRRLIIAAVLLALAAPACLKRIDHAQNKKRSVKNELRYGPIEAYGARCDHEKWDVPYAPDQPYSKDLTLDVYWNDHEGAVPVIINIHGGAWEVGDKRSLDAVFRSKFIANRGYVVMSINYRMKPEVPIQTQVEDVFGAVIWAKENAAKFGGDPERVGVTGGSAGGHLTTMVAWASDDPYFVPTSHANSQYRPDVKAAVPLYGVYDLEELLSLGNDYLKPITYSYFTGAKGKDEQAEIFAHVSPKNHLRPGLPPTFFICGDRDEFDLYHDAQAYSERLRELNVPTGLYTARGEIHAFELDYYTPNSKEAMEATVAWFDQYLK